MIDDTAGHEAESHRDVAGRDENRSAAASDTPPDAETRPSGEQTVLTRRTALASLPGLAGLGLLGSRSSAGRGDSEEARDEPAVGPRLSHTVTFPSPSRYGVRDFGATLALSADGRTALVGAVENRVNAGREAWVVYVFTRTATGWDAENPVPLPDPDPVCGTFHGPVAAELSADGTTALVGVWDEDSDAGTAVGEAYVFTRTESGWDTEDPVTLPNPDPDALDVFGWDVALSDDGNTALVGASGESGSGGEFVGEAYVFTRTESEWDAENPVTLPNPDPEASDPAAGDRFGSSVALSGDGTTALVGMCSANCGEGTPDPGAGYLFTRTEARWDTANPVRLTNPVGDPADFFGYEVALSGDGNTALVSTPAVRTSAGWGVGEAYVFTRTETGWDAANPVTLPNPDPDDGDLFGGHAELSTDGRTALVGAHRDDETGGRAYLFTRSETGWETENPVALSDPTPYSDGRFGSDVALSGDGTAALVGAPREQQVYLFESGQPPLVFEDQTSDGESVTVSSVRMPKPGFVVIASADGETVYGVSDPFALPTTRLRIDLDTPLPGDGTYLAAGQADSNHNAQFDAPRVLDECRLAVDDEPLLDTADIVVQGD